MRGETGSVLDISSVISSVVWRRSVMEGLPPGGVTSPAFRVMQRDMWTCAGCGCPSSPVGEDFWGGLLVHHKDDDPDNFSPGNLVTVCPLCHGLLHLDIMLGEGRLRGRFLWAPGIPQADLTMLTHLTAVADLRSRGARDRAACEPENLIQAEKEALFVRGQALRLWQAAFSAGLPSGLFVLPDGRDLGEALQNDPGMAAGGLGRVVREGSRAERARLARALRGLRWICDWRCDHAAAVYAESPFWSAGPGWAEEWLAWAGLRGMPGTP